ncbi:MAG: hypothetical protein M3Y28_12185, partial [Armatimonadota bacterium]|nr:hypothetical protein [Armatimonadota bacterium]
AAPVRRHATPPASYLQYRVYTLDQLIQQVSDNPTVRKRFARHFHISESNVVRYMKANLVESYVPKTERYTVYCVRPSGKFYPIRQTFKRGTKVFALKNGEPVMKWLCGNPLSKFLPEVSTRTIVQTPPKPRPVVLVSPTLQELTPTETANILIPSEIYAPSYQTAVPLSLVSAATPIYSRAGTSLLPFLIPAALVGAVASGGHGGGNTPTPIPAVPEAGSLVYLAAALPLGLIAVRRRRVKDAQNG